MIREIRMQVGGAFWLHKGFMLFKRVKLIYAGMSSPETYSLVIRSQDGYQAYAYNLYFQKDTSQIEVEGYRLTITCVSANEIWFTCTPEKENAERGDLV